MTNKTIFIIFLILALASSILALLLLANPFKKNKSESEGLPHGKFSFEADTKYEDTTDEYDPSLEPGSELADNNVYFTNYELLFDFLTVDAVGSISYHTAGFLNAHGYGGYHELTILPETINDDITYPRFMCSLDDTERIIEIRYRANLQEFEFNIVNNIY